MSEIPSQMPPAAGPAQPRGPVSRGIKIILALSLALNLLIIGMFAGAAFQRHGRVHAPREAQFGLFTEALSEDDRRALRAAFAQRVPNPGAMRRAAADDRARFLAALRADPFDPAAAVAALEAHGARLSARMALGHELLGARIAEMSAADRRAFADRLEARLARHARK